MSEFKGTKGEWSTTRIIKSNSVGAEYITIDMLINGSGVEGLAHVYEGCLGTDREAEMVANAQLISCAPEMLEALKVGRQAVIELMDHEEGWEDEYTYIDNLITKATTI